MTDRSSLWNQETVGRLVLSGSISHSHHVKVSTEQMSSSFIFFSILLWLLLLCLPTFLFSRPPAQAPRKDSRTPPIKNQKRLGSLISPQWFGGSQLRCRNTALVRVRGHFVVAFTRWPPPGHHYRSPCLMSYSVLANLLVVGREMMLIGNNGYLFQWLCFAFCGSLFISRTHTCSPAQSHRHGSTSTNTRQSLAAAVICSYQLAEYLPFVR